MSTYGTLLRLNLLNRVAGLRKGSWRKENGKPDVSRIVGLVMSAIAFVMLGGFVILLEFLMFKGLSAIGQPLLLPAMALTMCMAGMVLISFFYVLSSLYFSRDMVWMGYLPVRSRTVLAAKLTEVWVGEMLLGAVVLAPAFILFGIAEGAGVAYYLRAALLTLLAPLLPLCVITLVATLLTCTTAMSRHKDALIMISSLVLVVAYLLVEMKFLGKMPDEPDMAWLMQMLLTREGLLTQVTSFFPPVMWAVRGLTGDAGQMLLFAGISVGGLAACWYLLGGRYLALALRQSENTGRRHAARLTERTWRVTPPLKAVFDREMSEVLRTPTYAFNCLSGTVMFPLVMVIMFTAGSGSGDMSAAFDLLSQALDSLAAMDLLLILTGIMTFVTFMNPAVDTAVSREGGRHELFRMLPVSARTMLTAKMLMGTALNVVSGVTMVIALLFLLPGHGALSLLALAIALLPAVSTSAFSLLMDVLRPNFHWTNETQAIKQNTNVFFGMLASLVLIALPVAVALLLLSSAPVLRFLAVMGVLLAETAVSLILLRTVGEKRYAALEDAAA